MSTLIIETSTAEGSLALVSKDQVTLERVFAGGRRHNALIFDSLSEVFSQPVTIERVLVGSGPGSYSGTRVGIAAAQGVAIAHHCPAIAIPSILALPSASNPAGCLVVGDARRGSFWHAEISEFTLLSDPILSEVSAFQAVVADAHKRGLEVVCSEVIQASPLSDDLPVRLETPSAARLWAAWQQASEQQQARWSEPVPQPQYLKPPHITPAKARHPQT